MAYYQKYQVPSDLNRKFFTKEHRVDNSCFVYDKERNVIMVKSASQEFEDRHMLPMSNRTDDTRMAIAVYSPKTKKHKLFQKTGAVKSIGNTYFNVWKPMANDLKRSGLELFVPIT